VFIWITECRCAWNLLVNKRHGNGVIKAGTKKSSRMGARGAGVGAGS